eukprot:TRINITY_DN103128_c0_g1_i1.p1 TRINITY_DN103128_c0_g1~~TRINITY_DN103128_c0_g1_i1.p1  ORF type:complete len:526 (+),score=55.97 TRINITY_DN103128_c0_g1_i1:83-1660(+)
MSHAQKKDPDEDTPNFIGGYKVQRTLGRGSHATVKLGCHQKTGELVAIKVIKQSQLQANQNLLARVRREIDIMKFVRHPSITQLLDVVQDNKRIFLILEYMKGGDLLHYLRKHGAGGLPPEDAFRFFHRILSGLEYCHSCCVCHRDIKPENILLDTDRNAKLADFGMANILSKGKLLETSCGSPHYAAPEVIRGEKYDGTKSDVWSLGVVLFGLCAGRLPFDDQSIPRLLEKVVDGKFHMPTQFNASLQELITRVLQSDHTKRATLQDIKDSMWWKTNCQVYGLDPNGQHEFPKTGGPALKQAPQRTISPKVPSSAELQACLAADCDELSDVEQLRAMCKQLQGVVSYLMEEANKKGVGLGPGAANKGPGPADAMALFMRPIPPSEMQLAVPEPYDQEVIEYIVAFQGWSDVNTITALLSDSKPSLEKAFYKLVLQQKKVQGTLSPYSQNSSSASTTTPEPTSYQESSASTLSASNNQRAVSPGPRGDHDEDGPKKKGIMGRFKNALHRGGKPGEEGYTNVRPAT